MDELSRLRGSEGYEVCLDEVKQKRAQGECLGTGSRKQALIRGYPNGETRRGNTTSTVPESNRVRWGTA